MNYTFGQIEKELYENGRIWQSNKMSNRPSARDYRRIERWREIARNMGYDRRTINDIEMAGERDDKRFATHNPDLEFMGIEDYGAGVKLRLYNYMAVDRSHASTMRVLDLVLKNMWPDDIWLGQSIWECFKAVYSDLKQKTLLWQYEVGQRIKAWKLNSR